METHLLAPVAIFRAYQPSKSALFQHVRKRAFGKANMCFRIEKLTKSQELSFLAMSDLPIVVLLGAGMIFLGTGVAMWIVVSIVRQSRKDESFHD
jgi:hypothetical protein